MAYDYIVVGGGVAGAILAFRLAEHGDVALIERDTVMGGASARATGIISVQLPQPFLSWTLESLDFYRRLGEGLVRAIEGLLVTTEECADRLSSHLAGQGISSERLTKSEAEEIAGIPLNEAGDSGFLLTTEALVDPGTLSSKLRGLLLESGIALLEGRIASIHGETVRIEGGESLKATQAVIVSAGAWTPRVIGYPPELLAGSTLYRCEAHSVEVPRPPRVILYEDRSGAYMVPESRSTCIVGDGPNSRLALVDEGYTPGPYSVYQVLEELAQATPVALEATPRTSWSAPCIATGDGWPLLGRIHGKLYVFAGLDGIGLMIAPALARILANHISRNEPLPPGMEPLRSARPWRPQVEPPPEPYRWGC